VDGKRAHRIEVVQDDALGNPRQERKDLTVIRLHDHRDRAQSGGRGAGRRGSGNTRSHI